MKDLPYPSIFQTVRQLPTESVITVSITIQRVGDFVPYSLTFALPASNTDELDKVFKVLCADLFGHHATCKIEIKT